MANRLKIVPKHKNPAPPSDEIPDIVWHYSCKVWYTNEEHRRKWIAAVQYLRTTKRGWHIDDKPITDLKQRTQQSL